MAIVERYVFSNNINNVFQCIHVCEWKTVQKCAHWEKSYIFESPDFYICAVTLQSACTWVLIFRFWGCTLSQNVISLSNVKFFKLLYIQITRRFSVEAEVFIGESDFTLFMIISNLWKRVVASIKWRQLPDILHW